MQIAHTTAARRWTYDALITHRAQIVKFNADSVEVVSEGISEVPPSAKRLRKPAIVGMFTFGVAPEPGPDCRVNPSAYTCCSPVSEELAVERHEIRTSLLARLPLKLLEATPLRASR